MARVPHILKLLSGPEDIGRSWWFWAVFIAACVFMLVYPRWLSEFQATNIAYYLLNVPIALGLALQL
jgi:branched-chain amino acid transport system permease protein